jgi:hypothetical protein
MADTIHGIDLPITLEDVLRLREMERGSSMYDQLSTEPDDSANKVSDQVDRKGASRARSRHTSLKQRCADQ